MISKSTLKRVLRRLNLRRRKNFSDVVDVAPFILEELESTGQLHGYRWMHLKCKQAGFNIPRDMVYELLKLLDPEGVSQRKRKRLRRRQYKSKGPNYVWHIDSYDKLKPFGIAINGCIDGFSRNVIWLEANTTNSNPKVIAGYFIEAVKRKKGCPQRIRADLGTENSYIEQMQIFLRRNHEDELGGDQSFLYGKSTHNQRIEWFWGLLRRQKGQFYISLFKDLASDEQGLFTGDLLDQTLVQFRFMKLIQEELDHLAAKWKNHSIASKDATLRGANRPLMMYTLPELYNAEDRLCLVDEDEIVMCEEETVRKPEFPYDETVKEICYILLEENNMAFPKDAKEALITYQELRVKLRALL